ncbi:MAG: hypothetical protein N3E37_05185 [Candidatus Micrarchaeota archaeon]|nr:hypothetical protein [Candidatus Micrarchaeota archaeon]
MNEIQNEGGKAMPSIHYDPKIDRMIKERAVKNALKKVKDAISSMVKGDLNKSKNDIKEAGKELTKGFMVYY